MQCSLYVTDRCNLDCQYCTEYDNTVPHPATADLKRWIEKIRALGTERIAFVGGEPLTHPDIVDLVRQMLFEAMAAYPAQKKIMFGCPAYFVHGNMFAGVHQDSLMIRLSEADQRELMQKNDEISHFEPMPGRPMKKYLVLPVSLLEDTREFGHWLRRSFEYASSLPPKRPKGEKKKSRQVAKKR